MQLSGFNLTKNGGGMNGPRHDELELGVTVIELDVVACEPFPAASRNEVPDGTDKEVLKMPASSFEEGVTVKLNGSDAKGRTVMLKGERCSSCESDQRIEICLHWAIVLGRSSRSIARARRTLIPNPIANRTSQCIEGRWKEVKEPEEGIYPGVVYQA
jgi:hypothetical protein